MSESTSELDKVMDKHFAMAGIEPDKQGEGEDNDNSGDESQNAQADESSSSAESDKAKQGEGGQDALSSEAAKDDKSNQQSSRDDGKGKQGKEEKGKGAANPGDLTLPSGEVVKAGAERRWFQTAEHRQQMLVQRSNELNTARQMIGNLETRIKAIEEASSALGVADPTEVQKALRLYKDLRDKPQDTMKQLLVDLKAGGYTFDGIGPSVDTDAISRLIDQKLGTSARDGNGQQQEQDDSAVVVTNFLRAYPDAAMHEQEIGFVIESFTAQGREISLEDAYSALKEQAIAAGLDWNTPLKPQIEAAMAARESQQKQQGNRQQQRDPAPVNGRAAIGDVSEGFELSKITNQSESIEDAILAGMRDAGLNYSRG